MRADVAALAKAPASSGTLVCSRPEGFIMVGKKHLGINAPGAHGRLYTTIGRFLPDLIFGANDGIITTLAVVSGVVGAALSSSVILILGFANLLADGFSMGVSNVLSRRSDTQSDLVPLAAASRHGLATVIGFKIGRASCRE